MRMRTYFKPYSFQGEDCSWAFDYVGTLMHRNSVSRFSQYHCTRPCDHRTPRTLTWLSA